VFVNGVRVEVPPGALVADALRAWDAEAAREVAAGARPLTDSRGLPLDPSAKLAAGSIVRVGLARGAAAEE